MQPVAKLLHFLQVRGVLTAAITMLLTVTSFSTVHAQVRPDSIRTDTLRRPGAPLDSQVAPGVTADSAARELRQRRIDSIAAFRRIDTIKAPFVNFEKPRSFELDDRLRFQHPILGASNIILGHHLFSPSFL